MKSIVTVDVLEADILRLGKKVLDNLLRDRTTGRNIIWATDDYLHCGQEYNARAEITVPLITGYNSQVIQPRITKAKKHQSNRTRAKAEVFTPSWICNMQNNIIDEEWFGRKNVFNCVVGDTWTTVKGNINFPDKPSKSWKKYVDAKRLEITCGEAPYLVSRYDTVTGNVISLGDRIGLLDRKLRVVNENTNSEEDWWKWAKRAFESVYGYEYQGDNLLLARENLLYTFIDNVVYKFDHMPDEAKLLDISRIISWNIWQMDGISLTVPFGKFEDCFYQISLFEAEDGFEEEQPTQKLCKITDWRSKESMTYKSLLRGSL